MIKILTIEQTRAVEAAADKSGISYGEMMERAGRVVAFRVSELLERLPAGDRAVTFLIGAGNNGGDGLVAARHLAERGVALVRCYLLRRRDDDPLMQNLADAGVSIAYADQDQRCRVLMHMIASANIVIDALFGVGVRLPLRDEAAALLRFAAQALDEGVGEPPLIDPASPAPPQRRRPYVLAVDCPSGLDCDSGEIDKLALKADETLTFIAAKPGLLTFPGAASVGELRVSSLGIPVNMSELKAAARFLVDATYVRERLPERSPNAHKGTFGKALIVGGSINYIGAPALAANAAYAVGAGLVTVATPDPLVEVIGAALLETTWLPLAHDLGVIDADAAELVIGEATGYDALLIGCGIGRDKTTQAFLASVLSGGKAGGRSIGFTSSAAALPPDQPPPLPPLVLDADALNIVSHWNSWWTRLPPNTILTPHPGEMARLCALSTEDVEASRWTLAAEKAAAWNCVVVLKGAHTLIAAPSGELAALPFKTSALAKAGTGDTLAGMIVGLLAQGVRAFEAAVCAAYLHGAAGLRAAQTYGERGTMASHVSEAVRALLA